MLRFAHPSYDGLRFNTNAVPVSATGAMVSAFGDSGQECIAGAGGNVWGIDESNYALTLNNVDVTGAMGSLNGRVTNLV